LRAAKKREEGQAESAKYLKEIVDSGRSGWANFVDPQEGRQLCDNLLKGNKAIRVLTTPSKDSLEDAIGQKVMPWDSLKEHGKLSFGICAKVNKNPLRFLADHFKTIKEELSKEGWQSCIICHFVDSNFEDQPFKIGWI
jgi:hypothetical protein